MRKTSWRAILLSAFTSISLANLGCAQGPFPFTHDWYAERAGDPPGARQVESHGKLWPPYPRAVGRKQTKVHTYHYAHYWPYPHNCEDEAFTRNIIDLQASNGWTNATTLHDYHFNADTQQLTEGGRSHLLWVAQSVPPQYRTIYVSQGTSRETAQLRIESSEQYLRDMGIENPPPILARAEDFIGRPAVEVDRIRTLELNSIPRPRLFYIGSATAGGGGGGGGGTSGGGTSGSGTSSSGSGGGATSQPGQGFN